MAAPLCSSNIFIPSGIMLDILARLPVKSLLRFKCVCKDWYNLIGSSEFIKRHLNEDTPMKPNNSSRHQQRRRPFFVAHKKSLYLGEDIDSPTTQLTKLKWADDFVPDSEFSHVVGSCNGLICFGHNTNPEHFVICNPSTRTFKVVRGDDNFEGTKDHYYPVYGFGYDSQNDDYKILLIIMGEHRHIWIYSLKANSWRKGSSCRLHQLPFQKKFYVTQMLYAVFGYGILHCIVRGVDNGCRAILDSSQDYTDEEELQISRFNLSSEDWEDDFGFPNKTIHPRNYYRWVRSVFLDGCFCLSTFSFDSKLDIWIMREYGIKESWTKLFRCNLSSSYDPIAFSRTRPEGLWFQNHTREGLLWYDPKQETKEHFKLDVFHNKVMLCVESLVSIPESSYMFEEEFQAKEEDTTLVLPTFPEKRKKKQKKVLYYSWSRTS